MIRTASVVFKALAVTGLTCFLSATLNGQTLCATSPKDVGCVIPNLFSASASGITLPNSTHSAHFLDDTDFTANFLPLNTAVATQLTLLPLPSPASALSFELEAKSGVRVPRARTLGPILAERGETLGSMRLFMGFAYQRFRFSKIDGNKTDNLPVVFTHQPGTGPGGTSPTYELDVITAKNDIKLNIDQFTLFGSFGLTSRTDVSLAVPIMNVSMDASAFTEIHRIGTAGCTSAANCFHYFDANDPVNSTTHTFTNKGSASGIGDLTVRVKENLYQSPRYSVAVLGDLRLPTGDENNFLGSGAVGVKPFLALSMNGESFSPHVNVGYQWNGKSTLAGDLLAGVEKSLPKQFFYSFGTEYKALPKVTVSADLIGQHLSSVTGVNTRVNIVNKAASGQTFQTMNFSSSGFGINNASLGAKYIMNERFVATINMLISVDSGGLRQRVTPLFGVSYLF